MYYVIGRAIVDGIHYTDGPYKTYDEAIKTRNHQYEFGSIVAKQVCDAEEDYLNHVEGDENDD